MKKLDEQIEAIKKNKASLDIFEAIAESTLKMCMEKFEGDKNILPQVEVNVNQEFYNEIEKELLLLESQL
jgi:hypothetical protein